MSINLNPESVKQFCNNSRQMMVYGWSSCKYIEVKEALKQLVCLSLSKVYDFTLGDTSYVSSTPEGRKIYKFEFVKPESDGLLICRLGKAAILNLVFENYKRKKEGLPIIPLIFCYDIDGKKRLVTPEMIFSRADEAKKKIITNSELRLIYKLCHISHNDPILAGISAVASETIRFVKLTENQYGYDMQEIFPVWEDALWTDAWKQRQISRVSENKSKGLDWENQLKQAIFKLQIVSPEVSWGY